MLWVQTLGLGMIRGTGMGRAEGCMRQILVGALLLFVAAAQAAAEFSLSVGSNVDINRQSGYQAEEAVAIDPTNPSRMFAWSNDLGARNSAAFSTNGGASWT